MSIALGNDKPEQLQDIEKLIWQALFTLSEGMKAPEDVLGDLLHQIPWQTLQPLFLMPPQQEWFMMQATLAPSTSSPFPASSLPASDSNAMDESFNYEPQPPTLDQLPTTAGSQGFVVQSLSNRRSTRLAIEKSKEAPKVTAESKAPQKNMTRKRPRMESMVDGRYRQTDFDGFGGMNEGTPSSNSPSPCQSPCIRVFWERGSQNSYLLPDEIPFEGDTSEG